MTRSISYRGQGEGKACFLGNAGENVESKRILTKGALISSRG